MLYMSSILHDSSCILFELFELPLHVEGVLVVSFLSGELGIYARAVTDANPATEPGGGLRHFDGWASQRLRSGYPCRVRSTFNVVCATVLHMTSFSSFATLHTILPQLTSYLTALD